MALGTRLNLLSLQTSTRPSPLLDWEMANRSFLFHIKGDASAPVISALNDRELEQMENMRRRLHQLAKVILCSI
jgi:hypothetical protein